MNTFLALEEKALCCRQKKPFVKITQAICLQLRFFGLKFGLKRARYLDLNRVSKN